MKINTIIPGDALTVLKTLPDNSADCCISSPPYWGLRDYGVPGQIGHEPTPEIYMQSLLKIFREVWRTLKPSGTCFINLGDTYAGNGAGTTKNADISEYIRRSKQSYVLPNGVAKSAIFRGTSMHKSTLMIPYRFAWKMVLDGWTLRNIIIWHKPNQMPSSAKDRFTVDFEPVFFFVKCGKGYYFNQLLEPYTKPINRWGGNKFNALPGKSAWSNATGQKMYRNRDVRPNPKGRNMRTVWSINTKPFKGAHFATYPEKLIERLLLAGCSEDGIVLDPFMGAGTTAVVAKKLNRNFIGIELNQEYCEMAEQRLKTN
ncbi:MAG: site-specific DNA-methyltransferase [Prevotellaceae bacterium]|jgi:site-specific DNA-methyltransferase (adenine-specific)|nr:site-specific DNA-methyltransferase [Prevotellaceae bacterium]